MQTRRRREEPPSDKRPSSRNLFDLYHACIANAEELLEEAGILFDARRFARAYALAYTAYEEVGKSQVVADFYSDLVSEGEFQDAFRDHRVKAGYLRRNVVLPTGEIVYEGLFSASLFDARNNALYVSRTPDWLPRTPDAAVSEDLAKNMLNEVRQELYEIENAVWLNQRIGSKGLFK